MKGFTAPLTVELLSSGTGSFYPDPAFMSFISMGPDFRKAEQAVLTRLRTERFWPEEADFDIRWRLLFHEGKRLRTLDGGSIGAAFLLALARLLVVTGVSERNFTELRDLDLSGVAVTAQIDAENGTFEPMGHVFDKLLEAARSDLPRIHTVLTSESPDTLSGFGLVVDPRDDTKQAFKDPNQDFFVLSAGDLEEGAEELHKNNERWDIDCSIDLPDPEFVGREELFRDIRDFVVTGRE